MECFAKTFNGFQSLIIFAKGSVLDVWQGPGYAFEIYFAFSKTSDMPAPSKFKHVKTEINIQ